MIFLPECMLSQFLKGALGRARMGYVIKETAAPKVRAIMEKIEANG